MGIKVVATCTEYIIAGVLIHLQFPANKAVFNLLDKSEFRKIAFRITRNQVCVKSELQIGIVYDSLTFEKGVCCDRKERQLNKCFTKYERFKPNRWVQHHGVSEFRCIPTQDVFKLQCKG